ncbi:MAG: 50S ribosomal protein L35 [Puniceicoccales bacterium]|nr:50S ribosomal protein L35 [Puniceicoccales bacterium]
MLKTKKSIAKRIKITGNGKILHRTPGHRHFLRTKTTKQRRRAHQDHDIASNGFKKQILRAVAVGF